MVKSLPPNVEYIEDVGSIPGSGRFPGGGNGNPLQDTCLENPMDRGAWQSTVHGAVKIRHDFYSKIISYDKHTITHTKNELNL